MASVFQFGHENVSTACQQEGEHRRDKCKPRVDIMEDNEAVVQYGRSSSGDLGEKDRGVRPDCKSQFKLRRQIADVAGKKRCMSLSIFQEVNELGLWRASSLAAGLHWSCCSCMRAQQLQQRFPQVTRSLLSRVPSGVLASGALCIANSYVRDRPFSLDSTPSRIGSSAWFLSCVIWVCLLQAGAHWG